MHVQRLTKLDAHAWRLEAQGRMAVAPVLYADRRLLEAMEDTVASQLSGVASLPGVCGVCAMPDAHSGYGFPIGGVAAFDPQQGGVVSAGGVGYDIACGVRSLRTNLTGDDIRSRHKALADGLAQAVPAGLGRQGPLRLTPAQMEAMLTKGAVWAVEAGYGEAADLDYVEEGGAMAGADPGCVSAKAKERQREELGSLGSGNHYLEVQEVVEIRQPRVAAAFGLSLGQAVVSIHCGSRGLGHQIGTEYLARMAAAAPEFGLRLPDKELACAPALSSLGREYLGAMRAGINCALANRQLLSHLAREAMAAIFPQARLSLIYDVSHNTCKHETHLVNGQPRKLLVHRKGATRSLPAGAPGLPPAYAAVGQPVLVGGSMGTASYILAGGPRSLERSFGSACHGAGRAMSRQQAAKRFQGRTVGEALRSQGIEIRSSSWRGVAEEAPGAYKDVDAVIAATQAAGLATVVARLAPLVCIKG